MKMYLSVGKLRFVTGLQYRTAAFAGILTQLFFGFVFIMVYVAFYNRSGAQPPMTLQEVITYIWLQQMFLSLIALYFRDPDIFQLITGGNIAYELCRPCGLYGFWFAKLLATRVSSVVLRCFPLLVTVLLLPNPYGMSLPPSITAFLLFLLSLLLGLLIVCAISLLIYISVFWTMSPTGSTLMVATAGEFLAGMILPIPLMPIWMQKLANSLPFRWTVDFPFRVYTGHIAAAEALEGLMIQLFWLALLTGLGLLLINRALRRVVVQGG
ncbi:ABC transporter permease [Paenibacillus sp. URB8-2]|uniref:ABC transporter permease n=1 Tax=Paenibacillus sp. URB8-2 TaxID=2741301 RepID=UPI0015B956C3|nr:ABC transporter permease [Paenibacillus sp. URB8-2]BCG59329.1 ABC transporter permease [Paenibacillus sp. URB8-2]